LTNLDAFSLKATGTTKALALRSVVGLTSPTSHVSRFVGLTGKSPETRTTWIHVGYEGEWEGHPSGPFELTGRTFSQCVEAFRALATPPQVDYGHGSLYETDGQPKPAAGYVVDLEVRDDGLWACVEFTERAAGMVRGGEYRFCSGVFMWDQPDRVTGETIPCQLDSIGLTNRPFVDGQNAIRLHRVALGASMEITKKDLMAKVDALVDGDTITGAQLKALVAFIEGTTVEEEADEDAAAESMMMDASAKPALKAKALADVPPVDAPMADGEMAAEAAADGDTAAMVLTKLAELTGLDNASLIASLDANADQITAAFLGGDGGAIPYSALAAKSDVQSATIAKLSTELESFRTADAKRADDALVSEVESLVACGKVLPAHKGKWLALGRKAPQEFRAMSSTLSPVVPMGREAPKDAPATLSSGTDAEPDKSHPRYAVLSTHYANPKGPWSQHLPSPGPARDERIHSLVINHIRREQPVSG